MTAVGILLVTSATMFTLIIFSILFDYYMTFKFRGNMKTNMEIVAEIDHQIEFLVENSYRKNEQYMEVSKLLEQLISLRKFIFSESECEKGL